MGRRSPRHTPACRRRRRRDPHRRRRGSLSVTAVVVLLIVFVVSLGLLTVSANTLRNGARQPARVALRALAEAGIQYGYWQFAHQSAVLPFTENSRALGSGNVSVTVTDYSATITDSIRVVSTAALDAQTLSLTRILPKPTAQTRIKGTVFEDVNYGSGAGRSLSSSAGAACANARVEVYDSGGNYSAATTTGGDGTYEIVVLPSSTYTVRVAADSVVSTRPTTGAAGTPLAVPTFRTNAATGAAVAVTDAVGGADPGKADAASNVSNATLGTLATATTAAQTVTTVAMGTTAITGVDFGFNFDTIVNKNDSGQGSLRQFLINANVLANTGLAQSGRTAGIENALFMLADGTARAGMNAGYASQFTGGVATVTLASALPAITNPLVLDAQTQPGWASAPIVELNGAGAGAGVNGLIVNAGGSTLRGLVINRFTGSGIYLDVAGSNTVAGCYIGTNTAGTAASANGGTGITVNTGNGNTIGGTSTALRNVISGNASIGIYVAGTSSGNTIQGNYVGVNAAGSAAIGNNRGVQFTGGSNTLGGTAAGAGNVISGNTTFGVYLNSTSAANNLIQGNTIGLNAAGTAAVANTSNGIYFNISTNVGALNNLVGGTTTAARNVISGNGSHAIYLQAAGANGNTFQNNYIGLNAAGTAAIANNGHGIYIFNACQNNTIGGSGTGNVLSGNTQSGVRILAGSGNVVQGNYAGTNAAGTAAVPNGRTGSTCPARPSAARAPGRATSRRATPAAGSSFPAAAPSRATTPAPMPPARPPSPTPSTGFTPPTTATPSAARLPARQPRLGQHRQRDLRRRRFDPHPGEHGRPQRRWDRRRGQRAERHLRRQRQQYRRRHDLGGAQRRFRERAVRHLPERQRGQRQHAPGQLYRPQRRRNGRRRQQQRRGLPPGRPEQHGRRDGRGRRKRHLGELGIGLSLSGSGATGNTVQGNIIGLTAAGATMTRTQDNGIAIAAPSNTIGGTTSGAGNVICRSVAAGVYITGAGNTLQGNYIGTNASGTSFLGNGDDGITIVGAASNVIGGTSTAARNIISGNSTNGIQILNAGATGNTVQGNYIGLNPAGTAALQNSADGIYLYNAPSNTVGGTASGAGNVISGNTSNGVTLSGSGATGNLVQGNTIGLNAAGSARLANGTNGVSIATASNNTIGGTVSAARNVISGNTASGIFVSGTSGGTIQGNYIGTNTGGTAAISNQGNGIHISGSSGITIGGASAAARNIISGNSGAGIWAATSSTTVTIQGNYIGTNAAGSGAIANSWVGIGLHESSSNTIGGTAAGAGNVISGNGSSGLWIYSNSSSNLVQGNYIGLNAAGTAGLANAGNGVEINAANNTIGGTAAGAGNTICSNTGRGVSLVLGNGNGIRRNAIFSNGGLGIDMTTLGNGVTANNGSKNTGIGNSEMDFPVFTSATVSNTTLTVSGYVGSAANQATFAGATVEIFKSDSDASGYGEGPTYLGALTADASGNFSGSLTVSGVAVGDRITATATDGSNNTSEFGANTTTTSPTATMFDHALFSNATVSDSTRSFVLGAGGSGGDVRTNASLSMTNAGNAINGTARAPVSVSVTNCTGGASSGSGVATITMPALSTSFYQGIASQTYSGLTLNGGTFTFPSAYAVIYVTGDLNVNAATAISGTGTFCVTGNININGNISYANGSSKAAFLSRARSRSTVPPQALSASSTPTTTATRAAHHQRCADQQRRIARFRQLHLQRRLLHGQHHRRSLAERHDRG
jgi:hypothetical protein